MNEKLECPVDNILVNENKIRITALSVLLIAVIYLLTGCWALPAFLVADFFARAFKFPEYSLLNKISGLLIKIFSINNKPIDQAPKRFAAKIGFGFSVLILTAALSGNSLIAILLTLTMMCFAFLESFLGICAGCYVYTFLYRKP